MFGFMIWLCGWLLRAFRWRLILNAQKELKYLSVLKVLMVGFMGNNVLPLRAGEFVQAFLINHIDKNISKSTAFASVMVNRIFDGIAVVFFALIGLSSLPQIPVWLKQAVIFGAVLFAGAFGFSLILVKTPKLYILLLNILHKMLPESMQHFVIKLIENFIVGLSTFKSTWGIVVAIIISILIWGIEGLFYYFCIRAFGFNLSLLNAALVMGIMNLGVMVPTSPGAIGTYQYIMVQVMGLFAIVQAESLGLSLVIQFIQNISVILLGIISLYSLGFNFNVFKQNE